jgi:hypothetical protein
MDPLYIVLRLVRESNNWFEVEVNEVTRETKYVSKGDPLWSRVTWDDIFNINTIEFNHDKISLLDAPAGKVIAECEGEKYTVAKYRKLEGDWMYVEAGRSNLRGPCFGWLRWRDGRRILIGSVLNGHKPPN